MTHLRFYRTAQEAYGHRLCREDFVEQTGDNSFALAAAALLVIGITIGVMVA